MIIPDLSNMTEESARLALDRVGFSSVEIETEFSLEVDEDLVIRSVPGANNLHDRKQPVIIVLSLRAVVRPSGVPCIGYPILG